MATLRLAIAETRPTGTRSLLSSFQAVPVAPRLQVNRSRPTYWTKISHWKDITEQQFLSYRWQVSIDLATFSQDSINRSL